MMKHSPHDLCRSSDLDNPCQCAFCAAKQYSRGLSSRTKWWPSLFEIVTDVIAIISLFLTGYLFLLMGFALGAV